MFFTVFFIIVGCSSDSIRGSSYPFEYTEIRYENLEDVNQCGCSLISREKLTHILKTGVNKTSMEIHDHVSTVGCTVNGTLKRNGQVLDFLFDYGGVFYFSDDSMLVCAESCCSDGFEFCSWSEGGEQ
ncbi:hypothetical protein ACJJIF_02990 [Microbulbifer sp. SSSA002]|uniref:hypothetical protein n=1 Tax=unclassified Microbulbifer TaxID=2619833 RepID=UPI00403A0BAE